ncbi:hypothetical protein [Lewinella sp. W8]|uniref:hypothetical protein n=1 Tax=Lewinella sp. W8 TaxID=2528208 RepID=UPI00106745B9|nr:hypothetical protein [Lewinella sp. W8]MTB51218.1 hypothetical protein [Lewinella sp. W8]
MGNLSKKITSTSQSVAADAITATFHLTMRIINAALTFAFGFTYGGDFFPTGHPTLSASLGALTFVAIYDYGAYGWDAAGKRTSLSIRQLNITGKMSRASMYCSTLLSVAFLLLTTSLVDLSSIHDTIGLIAVLGTGVLLACHFVFIFAYLRASPAAVEAQQNAELRGCIEMAYSLRRKEIADQMQAKIQDRMTQHLDEFAEQEASREWNRFVTDMGYGGVAAGAKEETKEPSNPQPTPSPPAADAAEQEFIDYEELKGNARAAQEQNLNMAAG